MSCIVFRPDIIGRVVIAAFVNSQPRDCITSFGRTLRAVKHRNNITHSAGLDYTLQTICSFSDTVVCVCACVCADAVRELKHCLLYTSFFFLNQNFNHM